MLESDMNSFTQMDAAFANQLAHQFGSPLFIVNEAALLDRFSALQAAVKKRYAQACIAISYKTHFLSGVLSLLHHEGAHAEVVSGIEYTVAKKIRRNGQKIIFNGPMKTQDELLTAITDNAIINCDHEDEIDRIEKIAFTEQRQIPIGIRIYFTDVTLSWKRFGFGVRKDLADERTLQLVKRIIKSPFLKLAGLHAHIGTNIRDLNQFAELGAHLNEFALNLKKQFQVELEWLDVGGGLAGIVPTVKENKLDAYSLPDVDSYADAIIQPLLPYLNSLETRADLIFEPGRTLFEAAAGLLTKVVGRREANDQDLPALIFDAGINVLSTSYYYNFPIHVFNQHQPLQVTRLLGPTCNQHDQLHTPIALPRLQLNDFILFYGVGSYCMAFSFSFIRYKPGIILWRQDGSIEWLRHQETLEHNGLLENIPQPLQLRRAMA